MDLVLVTATVTLAWLARNNVGWFPPGDITDEVVGVGPLIVIAWMLALLLFDSYERESFDSGSLEYKQVTRATLSVAALTGIASYLTKYELPRGFYVLTFGLGILIVLVGRWIFRQAVASARRRGHLMHSVLVVGAPGHADELALRLSAERRLGYRVIGVVTPSYDTADATRSGLPVLGDVEEVADLAVSSGSDILMVAGGAFSTSQQLKELAWDLEHHPIQLVVAPSLRDVSGERVRFRPVDGLPLIHVEGTRGHLATKSAKRAFDLVASAALLLLLAPVLVGIALRVHLHDRGPALFKQIRIGRDGREFTCLKFRTMVPDAEALLEQLRADAAEGGLFKLKDDPRITKPGRWLRRSSLDELPQLINVLIGDMSLVGPRPPLPNEVANYPERMHRRLRVRPGITGLWQVSGRSDLSWDETMRLDLYYVDNWSMMQDLMILVRTVKAVVRSQGAY